MAAKVVKDASNTRMGPCKGKCPRLNVVHTPCMPDAVAMRKGTAKKASTAVECVQKRSQGMPGRHNKGPAKPLQPHGLRTAR